MFQHTPAYLADTLGSYPIDIYITSDNLDISSTAPYAIAIFIAGAIVVYCLLSRVWNPACCGPRLSGRMFPLADVDTTRRIDVECVAEFPILTWNALQSSPKLRRRRDCRVYFGVWMFERGAGHILTVTTSETPEILKNSCCYRGRVEFWKGRLVGNRKSALYCLEDLGSVCLGSLLFFGATASTFYILAISHLSDLLNFLISKFYFSLTFSTIYHPKFMIFGRSISASIS